MNVFLEIMVDLSMVFVEEDFFLHFFKEKTKAMALYMCMDFFLFLSSDDYEYDKWVYRKFPR